MTIRKAVRALVAADQRMAAALLEDLPTRAKTSGQWRLQRKHGSPKTFAKACIAALGEISYDECNAAIRKYALEWEEAGKPKMVVVSTAFPMSVKQLRKVYGV